MLLLCLFPGAFLQGKEYQKRPDQTLISGIIKPWVVEGRIKAGLIMRWKKWLVLSLS